MRVKSGLRVFWCRVTLPIGRFLAHEQGAGKDNYHANGDRGVGHVEDQERAEAADMEIGEVDHIAEPVAINDIPQRATEDQAERDDVAEQLLAQQPTQAISAVTATRTQRISMLSALNRPSETP